MEIGQLTQEEQNQTAADRQGPVGDVLTQSCLKSSPWPPSNSKINLVQSGPNRPEVYISYRIRKCDARAAGWSLGLTYHVSQDDKCSIYLIIDTYTT